MSEEPPPGRSCRNRVYISLGSNIDAAVNLPAAVRLLGEYGTIVAASSVYETLPVLFTDQADFLNAAVLLETERSLEDVFDVVVPGVEAALGRVRDPANPNGPRTIDLDVALFNDLVTRTKRHELPDPDITRRPFVAIPLAELDPAYVHPLLRQTLADIAAGMTVEPGDMRLRPDVHLRDREKAT